MQVFTSKSVIILINNSLIDQHIIKYEKIVLINNLFKILETRQHTNQNTIIWKINLKPNRLNFYLMYMSKEKKVNKLKYFNLKNKKKSFFLSAKRYIYIYTHT